MYLYSHSVARIQKLYLVMYLYSHSVARIWNCIGFCINQSIRNLVIQ